MVDPSRVEEIFLAALNKSTPEERAAYLDNVCRDVPQLRERVEELLAAHPKAIGFLEPPPANSGATDDSSPAKLGENGNAGVDTTREYIGTQGENGHAIDNAREHVGAPTEMIGSRIGPYKLLQRLGEGGMGTVYMAEQEHPVKRRVALKIIKTGMDSAQVAARFEQERQALAMMDHPNIAKVLDAGATETGRPYFVMELVKGIPITRFCDQEHLTPQERLELFVPVCQAVQHAHQKGIIHRDLKPSNVLIALDDGKAVPKVIDFGVAKATHQKLTERTMFTEVGSIVGTLEYMAPEQAELNNLDIDTRADIYSLGVLLYELLTGSPPFSSKQLRGAAFTEMLRMIREVEPPKPSTRLSSSDELPSIAANRKLEPRRLTSLVTGELDWIVMKALEKDRGRRYETANGLAMNIGRYLADEPVLASPPSTAYQIKKFVRRNKGPVSAAAGLLLALSAGVVGTTIGLVRAENARQAEAEQRKIAQAAAEQERLAKEEVQAKKLEAEAARDREAKERGHAEAIAKFVKDDFLALTSVEGQTRFDGEQLTKDATLRDLLGRAAEKLNDRKDLAPRTEAELCWIIGVSYRGVGEFAEAIRYLERSVELYRQELGPEEGATLNSQNSLAVAYGAAGQYDRAIRLHEKTLRLWKEKFGSDHPETLNSMGNLATAYGDAGKPYSALPLIEEAFKLTKATLGPEHPRTLTSMANLAAAYQAAGKLDLALLLFEETLKLFTAKFGPEHPHTLTCMNNLAETYEAAGKLELALPLYEETLKLRKAKLGPEHPDTLMSMNNLASAYYAAGKLDLALPLFEETLKFRKATLGRKHPDTLVSMNNLAAAYWVANKLDLALPLHEETLKLRKATLGSDHPDTLMSMNNLAEAYWVANKLDLALPLYEEALKLSKAKLGPDHPDTLMSMNNLALKYRQLGKLDLALPLFKETFTLFTAKLGLYHPDTLTSMNNLAEAYRQLGNLDLALPLFEETLKHRKATLGPDHPDTLTSMNNLAAAYWSTKQLDKSIPLFEETLKRQEARFGRDHPDTQMTVANLGVNYKDAGKLDLAVPLLEETLNFKKAKLGPDQPDTLVSMNDVASAYQAAGKLDLALPLFEETLKFRKAKLGPEHPDTLTSLNNLAEAYYAAGNLDLALPLFEETLKHRKATLGPDHPDTLISMNNLAAAYWSTKQLDKSVPLFEDVLKRQEAKLGRQHPTTQSTVANMGVNYKDAGRLPEAVPLLEEAHHASRQIPALRWVGAQLLDAYLKAGNNSEAAGLVQELLAESRKTVPQDSPQLASVLAQAGLTLFMAKAWTNAEPILRECLAICEKAEPDAWTTFYTKSMLGQALVGQEKFAEAEPLLVAGYEGPKEHEAAIPPEGKVRLTEALRRLIDFYAATGQAEKADEWRKKLDETKAGVEPKP